MNTKFTVYLVPVLFFLSCTLFVACGSDSADKKAQAVKKEMPAVTPSMSPLLDDLTTKIGANPMDATLYAQRGEVYYEREGYDEAIADFTKAIQLDEKKAIYHHVLADIYLDYSKSRLALNTMTRAGVLFPQGIPTLLKLAEFQIILRKNEEASATINRVLNIDPQSAEAFFMRGLNFKDMGKDKKAASSFQASVENDPDLVDAWIELGYLYEKQNNPLAERYFENALRVDSVNIFALSAKGNYLASRKEYQKAIQTFKKINRIDHQFTDAYYNIGLAYLQLDSLQQAHKHFDLTVKLEPTHYLAYYFRGKASEMQGKVAAAKQDYQQALNLSPNFPRAQEGLERTGGK